MDQITTPVVFGQSPPENSILHSTSVSFTSRSPSEPVHIVQYDLTIPVIAVSLTADGQSYTVPSGAAVNVRLAKPDGYYVYDPAYGVSSDGHTAYIAVTGQMTVAAGNLQPVIEIVVDGGTAATGSFSLIIDENPVPDSALQSSDEYLTMQQILAEVQAAAQLVENNQENLQNLSDNLEAVQNAAANAQAAAASATAAQQSAQEAAQSAQQALGFRTFFSAVSPDANGDLDPSRPMTTPSAQASWTVKSKGDRIQNVEVNGFSQNGNSAGLKMVRYYVDQTEAGYFAKIGPNGAYQYKPNVIPKPTAPAYLATVFCSVVKTNTGNSVYQGDKGIAVNDGSYISISFGGMSPSEYVNTFGPFTIWYVPADASQATGLYIPIQAQGHEYRCQCLPIAEALGTEDTVQSNVSSGCDQSITIDGSTVTVALSGSSYVATAANAAAGGAVYANGLASLSLLPGQALIPAASFPSTVTSAQTANAWLQSNPQIVYYQSTAYTEQVEISAELETHANGNIYAHPAVELVAVPYTEADTDHTPGTYDVSSQDGTTAQVSLKAMQDGGDAATVGGYTAAQLLSGSSDVDAATLNGQTATQILQSAQGTAQTYTQSYVQQQMQNVYTKSQTQQIVQSLYKATFSVSGWASSGGGYTQSVYAAPVSGGPMVTPQSIMTSGVFIDDTVQGTARSALKAAAKIVDGGTKTLGYGTITCTIQGSAPGADAEVFFNATGGVS